MSEKWAYQRGRLNRTVGKYSDFLIKCYANDSGKNKWNRICSAKDWLHTGVYGLPYVSIQHESDDMRSLTAMQVIMTFAFIVDSVKVLLDVFDIQDPYEDDQDVFNQDVRDDRYFKQIRAVFAAHPVDLNSTDGRYDRNSTKRYYASWSSDISGSGRFRSNQYSDDPRDTPKPISMSFAQVHAYALKRYELLERVIKAIIEKDRLFREAQRNLPIPTSNDLLTLLNTLSLENETRFGKNSGYSYQIDTLVRLYTAPKTISSDDLPAVEEYLDKLNNLVQDLYRAIQNMDYKELPHAGLLEARIDDYEQVSYNLEKVGEYLHNQSYFDTIVEHHIGRLADAGILPPYADVTMDKRDLELLLYAKLHVL